MARRVYLDWAATAPLRDSAKAAVLTALERFGNPSSIHREGQDARLMMDESRRKVADSLGVRAERVVLTSGGTEANNLALKGVMARRKGRLLVSSIEHDCVRNCAAVLGGGAVAASRHGVVGLPALRGELAKGDVALVSVMQANNEHGVMQPVKEIAALAHEFGALFHTDAIQTVGHVPVDVDGIGADLLSLSAHKFGGPKGAGALVVKSEIAMDALVTGGAQERNRRAGTENVAGMVGMAAALEEAMGGLESEAVRLRGLQDVLLAELAGLPVEVVGEGDKVPHVLQVVVPGWKGEDLVIAMDLKGVAVSQGSACSSGRIEASHVLEAMGYGVLAGSALRFSWGFATTEDDIRTGAQALREVLTA